MEDTKNKEIYLNLHNVAGEALSDNSLLRKEKIIDVLSPIIEAFQEDLYNEFLLFFYTQAREHYLTTHITNNVILALGFSQSLSLSQEDIMDVGLCAFGHDFGMAEYLPLFQKTEELKEEEARMIKNHTKKSAEIFQSIFSERVIAGILDVHEQIDGAGYPTGKPGVEISSLAKIVCICDVFESLTHVRNFRSAINPYEAIKFIIEKKNHVFDGSVINRFVDFLSIYPVGTLVLLNTNEVGIIIGSNDGYPTRCITKVLLDARRQSDQTGKIYNLRENKMVYIIEALSMDQVQELSSTFNFWGEIKV